MGRLSGAAAFLLMGIPLCIVGMSHYYVWCRLVRDTQLPSPWFQIASACIILLAIAIPVMLFMHRARSPWLSHAMVWFIFSWLGTFFLVLCLTIAVDLIGFFTTPLWPSLSQLLSARICAIVICALGSCASGWALYTARKGPVIMRTEVSLRRLPAKLDGFSIVQISDLHIATLLGRHYVEHVVAQSNALQADLIVITGDLVDGSVDELRDAVAPLAELKAKYGVYFVTGNHEYYSGVDAWLAYLKVLHIYPLRNERVVIGSADASFDLAGIDDWTAEYFGNGHGADLPRAVANRDTSRELILLAHQPKLVAQAAQHGVGLMLSGHTHGGQLWPFGYLVRLDQPYLAGLSQHQQSQTQIYVSRGTGYWGPPMRFAVPPELTHIILRHV